MVRRVLTAVVSLMAHSINSSTVSSNSGGAGVATTSTTSPSSALPLPANTNTTNTTTMNSGNNIVEGLDRRVIDW